MSTKLLKKFKKMKLKKIKKIFEKKIDFFLVNEDWLARIDGEGETK